MMRQYKVFFGKNVKCGANHMCNKSSMENMCYKYSARRSTKKKLYCDPRSL